MKMPSLLRAVAADLADGHAAIVQLVSTESALANLPIRRLYLGVDRQDYLVNWLGRKDKRNTRLSATAVGSI
jgi:hypothetical protein